MTNLAQMPAGDDEARGEDDVGLGQVRWEADGVRRVQAGERAALKQGYVDGRRPARGWLAEVNCEFDVHRQMPVPFEQAQQLGEQGGKGGTVEKAHEGDGQPWR